jgi:hypothetical protein
MAQIIRNAKYGPKIVTDGLVLALDAANTKSYPRSGTDWINLSDASITGSLVGGTTFDGANVGTLVFDGTNDEATLDRITGVTAFTTSSNYTISCWVYVNTSQNYSTYNYKNILTRRGRAVDDGRAGGGTNYNLVYQSSSASIGVSTANSAGQINFLLAPFETNTWNYVAAVYSWTTSLLTAYVNNQPTSTPLTITGSISGTEDLGIMQSQGIGNNTAGKLSMIMIHNRALSQQEVLQNFNATRGRFGV